MALKISVFTLEDDEGREADPHYTVMLSTPRMKVDLGLLDTMAQKRGLRIIQNEYEWSDSWLIIDYKE